jgi:hypothetical protein
MPKGMLMMSKLLPFDSIMTQTDFYNQYKDRVEKFGLLNVFEDREDRIAFRNAERAIRGAISFTHQKKSWTSGVINTKKVRVSVEWTDAEVDYLADLYLKFANPSQQSDNRELIVEQFRLKFDTHSDDAVEIAIRSFVQLDSFYPALGRTPNQRYYEVLNSKCPGRFEFKLS